MKIGFIGCGNMAKAMIGGIISSKIFKADEIIASDTNTTILEKAKTDLKINISNDNKDVAKNSEIIVLAVKPHMYEDVIEEITDYVDYKTIVISIAPGKALNYLESMFGEQTKIIRTMPNTPAMIAQGMTAICPNQYIKDRELDFICKIFGSFGKASVVSEHMMDAVVAVSGSAPAYVYMFIEALADGAVLGGMPRDKAYEFAAQTVFGSAQMVMQTGMHPAQLKDMVCSPGGTTIEAVKVLEEEGFRASVIKAMKACMDKASNM